MELREFMEIAEEIEQLEYEIKATVLAINSLGQDCNYCVSSIERAVFCTISSKHLVLGLLEKFKDLYGTYKNYISTLKDNGVNIENEFKKDPEIYKIIKHLKLEVE